ncbi:hypothetical protein E2C01_012250 [Portunus trituberculatus]|uniref:Uncharacterized protein n=1 Tax=Portunus trituberculatus TaxID=210409 RepID=A0A5B7DDN8_PORTR|nr:hypothetical protein [Portunus trituberculatus]
MLHKQQNYDSKIVSLWVDIKDRPPNASNQVNSSLWEEIN